MYSLSYFVISLCVVWIVCVGIATLVCYYYLMNRLHLPKDKQRTPISEVFRRSVCSKDGGGRLDVVYTWVNGGENEWVLRKMVSNGTKMCSAETDSANRYADNGELLFSLRSLFYYMKDILGHVYIITQQQEPDWLVEFPQRDRITIVDHRDIFPPWVGNVYNSNVIELWMGKIPGLSNFFIYMNDDMSISRNVDWSDFFAHDGIPFAFLEKKYSTALRFCLYNHYRNTPVGRMHLNTELLMDRLYPEQTKNMHFLRQPHFEITHAPYVMSKQWLDNFHRQFPELVREASTHRVRQLHDLVLTSYLMQNRMMDEGCMQGTVMFQVSMPAWRLSTEHNLSTCLQIITEERTFMCINDGRSVDESVGIVEGLMDSTSTMIRHFLSHVSFPLRSETNMALVRLLRTTYLTGPTKALVSTTKQHGTDNARITYKQKTWIL